jgi:hypothetical protein
MRNQIFLPGIDPETGAYASSMLGSTTVLSRTEVDSPGKTYDAERVSESRRDLKQAPELRRMVKYRQGIAIIDTADPILFRFLARADTGDVAVPPERALMPAPPLAEAVEAMTKIREIEKRPTQTETPKEATAPLRVTQSGRTSVEEIKRRTNSESRRIRGAGLTLDELVME